MTFTRASSPDLEHPAVPQRAANLPYRARLAARHPLAPDVWQLRFDVPHPANAAIAPWVFTAGQYTTIGVTDNDDLPLRPYSIASGAARSYIDLHVRDTGHGLSHALVTTINIGDTVAFGHPAGSCVPIHAQTRPLLLLAGGVGIAPMASILDDSQATAPRHLYWAVARADDLYLDALWKIRCNEGGLASYHALTADDTPGLRQGMVGPAVVADLPDLSSFAIYLAGPAAMIAATLPLLISHGAQKEYIFGDGITL